MKKFFKFLLILIIISFLSIFITYKYKQAKLDDSSLIIIKTSPESEENVNVVFDNKNIQSEKNEFDGNEYVIVSQKNPLTISVTSNTTKIITIVCTAPSEHSNLFYNEILIDGKPAITIPKEISFNAPYDYSFIAQKNKEYIIQIAWNKV